MYHWLDEYRWMDGWYIAIQGWSRWVYKSLDAYIGGWMDRYIGLIGCLSADRVVHSLSYCKNASFLLYSPVQYVHGGSLV